MIHYALKDLLRLGRIVSAVHDNEDVHQPAAQLRVGICRKIERDVRFDQRLIERAALVRDQRGQRADRRFARLGIAGNRICEIDDFERKRKLRLDRLSLSCMRTNRGVGRNPMGRNASEILIRQREYGGVVHVAGDHEAVSYTHLR